MPDPHALTDLAALEALYGTPGEASRIKVVDHLTPAYRQLVEASPFCVLATQSAGGIEVTPRGDAPGFVRVIDATTLELPDRRGNNRIDSLRNLITDPRVGLIFLVPGYEEALRVMGRAGISVDPARLEAHAVAGKRPTTVLVIRIERVFFQCARAVMRARLWDPAARVGEGEMPSVATLLKECRESFDTAAYGDDVRERLRANLY